MLANDRDVDGPALSIKSATVDPAEGTVAIVEGKLVFTPVANFNGAATIRYVATDGALDTAATAVTVTVSAVNDAPTWAADARGSRCRHHRPGHTGHRQRARGQRH